MLGAKNLSQPLLVNTASEQGQNQSSGLGLQAASQSDRRPKEQQQTTPAFATVQKSRPCSYDDLGPGSKLACEDLFNEFAYSFSCVLLLDTEATVR